jgi:hypothetical protein
VTQWVQLGAAPIYKQGATNDFMAIQDSGTAGWQPALIMQEAWAAKEDAL